MPTARTPNPREQRQRKIAPLMAGRPPGSGVSVLLGHAVTAEGAAGAAQPELALPTSVAFWQQGGLETAGVRE